MLPVAFSLEKRLAWTPLDYQDNLKSFSNGVLRRKTAACCQLATAIAAYHVAVAELEFGMIAAPAEVYATLRQKTEAARAVCEVARKRLDDHEVNHKCQAWTARAADPSRGVPLHRPS